MTVDVRIGALEARLDELTSVLAAVAGVTVLIR
jgi:hypothetical protein